MYVCVVVVDTADSIDAFYCAKELFMLGHVSDTISILTSFAIVCGFLYSFQADDEYDCIYTTISLSHQKQQQQQ